MIKRYLLLLLLGVVSSVFAFNNADLQLNKMLQRTTVIKADFLQVVLDEDGRTLSNSSGNFILERPDKFYWLINTPTKQVIVSDGSKIWNYQPDLEQVIVQPVSSAISSTPLAILSGSADALQRNFSIEQLDAQTFKLTAKNSAAFKYIWLYFKADVISSMKLEDALGQSTRLDFLHVTTNDTVSANQFKFTPPKGVDVIYNR